MAVPQSSWQRGEEFFRTTPVTKVIIIIWVVSFVASLLRVPLADRLAFHPSTSPLALIGLITYPLAVGLNPLTLLFAGLMLWWFGASLERSWLSRTYLLFLIGVTVAEALLWEVGVFLFTGHLIGLDGPWLMLSSIIVAWAWLNPEQTIMFWFVLPLKAKWVGWITIAADFIFLPLSITGPSLLLPVLGIFALGGPAAAYGYVWWRRKWGWIPRRRGQTSRRTVVRHPSSTIWGAMTRPFREWQRRRRVAKLQKTFRIDD